MPYDGDEPRDDGDPLPERRPTPFLDTVQSEALREAMVTQTGMLAARAWSMLSPMFRAWSQDTDVRACCPTHAGVFEAVVMAAAAGEAVRELILRMTLEFGRPASFEEAQALIQGAITDIPAERQNRGLKN